MLHRGRVDALRLGIGELAGLDIALLGKVHQLRSEVVAYAERQAVFAHQHIGHFLRRGPVQIELFQRAFRAHHQA
ncbi:hypothetical protein D3C86_1818510 [compost metagenome]